MKNTISIDDFNQSEYVDWNTVDLQEIYNNLNKKLYNNELPIHAIGDV